MNHIIAKEAYIPLRVKVEILNDLFPLAEIGNTEAHRKLFDYYKTYLSDAPKEDHWDCPGCRIKAWNHIRSVVSYWRELSI